MRAVYNHIRVLNQVSTGIQPACLVFIKITFVRVCVRASTYWGMCASGFEGINNLSGMML